MEKLDQIQLPAWDEWFEVEIQTFSDRWGVAANRDVDAAIADTAEMLLGMNEVVAGVTTRTTLLEK